VEGPTATLQGDASAPFGLAVAAEPVQPTLLERLQGRWR
jgi:hypothetical protein